MAGEVGLAGRERTGVDAATTFEIEKAKSRGLGDGGGRTRKRSGQSPSHV